jgi:hypothetical protein
VNAHLADFEQARVVIPIVGLADIEMQVAVRRHPRIERDVAVAQRHRAVMILAGRIPDGTEGVNRRSQRSQCGIAGEANEGEGLDDFHSCSSNSPS